MVVDYCGLGNGAFIQTLEKIKYKCVLIFFQRGKNEKSRKHIFRTHSFFLLCTPDTAHLHIQRGTTLRIFFLFINTIHVRAMSKLLFTKHTAPLHAEQRKNISIWLYVYPYNLYTAVDSFFFSSCTEHDFKRKNRTTKCVFFFLPQRPPIIFNYIYRTPLSTAVNIFNSTFYQPRLLTSFSPAIMACNVNVRFIFQRSIILRYNYMISVRYATPDSI